MQSAGRYSCLPEELTTVDRHVVGILVVTGCIGKA
jgi:hypothetical protein